MRYFLFLFILFPIVTYSQSGTITTNGNFTYINWSNGTQTVIRKIGEIYYIDEPDGSTTSVNQIGFNKYYNNAQNNIQGTSQEIGNTTYYNDNQGNSANATKIGNTTYISDTSGNITTLNSIGNTTYINNNTGNISTSDKTENSTIINKGTYRGINPSFSRNSGKTESMRSLEMADRRTQQNAQGLENASEIVGMATNILKVAAPLFKNMSKKKAVKEYNKYVELYSNDPKLEYAFEIEKNGATAKMENKWGPVIESHRQIVIKYKTYNKYLNNKKENLEIVNNDISDNANKKILSKKIDGELFSGSTDKLKDLNLNKFKYVVIDEVTSNSLALSKIKSSIHKKFIIKKLKKGEFNIVNVNSPEKTHSRLPKDILENPSIAVYLSSIVSCKVNCKTKVSLFDHNNQLIYEREVKDGLIKSGAQIIMEEFIDYNYEYFEEK